MMYDDTNTNTSRSVKRMSTMMVDKCEATQKNMKQLMTKAGCPEYKNVKVHIPMIPGSGDDVQSVGLNGVSFYFMKGKTVDMPEPLVSICENCKIF